MILTAALVLLAHSMQADYQEKPAWIYNPVDRLIKDKYDIECYDKTVRFCNQQLATLANSISNEVGETISDDTQEMLSLCLPRQLLGDDFRFIKLCLKDHRFYSPLAIRAINREQPLGVSRAGFMLLTTKMSLEEVRIILGSRGELSSSAAGGGYSFEIYTWTTRAGGVLTVSFEGDRLTGKSQVGLR